MSRTLTPFGEAVNRSKEKFPVMLEHTFRIEYLRNNKNTSNYELRCEYDKHRVSQEEKQSIYVEGFLKSAELYYTPSPASKAMQLMPGSTVGGYSREQVEKFCKTAFHDARTIYKGVKANDWWSEFKLQNDIK